MIKPIIPITIGIVIIAIVLIMIFNSTMSLESIIANKDCQELGKFDKRMDETYVLMSQIQRTFKNILNNFR